MELNQESPLSFEPTLFGALRRYRYLFVAVLVASLALGVLAVRLRSSDVIATADVIVRDPQSALVLGAGNNAQPDRYVSDQVAALHSSTVAEDALAILRKSGLSDGVQAKDILSRSSVTGSTTSSLIEIRYSAPTGRLAVAGADALLAAYRDLLRTQGEGRTTAATARFDTLITQIGTEIDAATTGLDQLRSPNPVQSPAYLALQETQSQLIQRRATLQQGRDAIVVNADPVSSGIVVSSNASDLPLKSAGSSTRALALAGLFGLAAAAAACYWLALRNRQFSDRYQPESIFRSPLLASIPTFASGNRLADLPVVTAPGSAAAEGFRFVASALDIHQAASRADGSDGGLVIAITSSERGDGKTVVSANACFALARNGMKVLLVDADLEIRGATALVHGDPSTGPGLGEALTFGAAIERSIMQVTAVDGTTMAFMPAGSSTNISSQLRSPAAQEAFTELKARYDVIVVDCPPLSHVAYATFAVRLADSAIAVVHHGATLPGNEALAERLEFSQVPLLGYVYNRSPVESNPDYRDRTQPSSRVASDGHKTANAITFNSLPVPSVSRPGRRNRTPVSNFWRTSQDRASDDSPDPTESVDPALPGRSPASGHNTD